MKRSSYPLEAAGELVDLFTAADFEVTTPDFRDVELTKRRNFNEPLDTGRSTSSDSPCELQWRLISRMTDPSGSKS
jgi:hypothetical protein